MKKLKDTAKRFLPKFVIVRAKKIREAWMLYTNGIMQLHRFWCWMSLSSSKSEDSLKTLLMFNAHRLEKGLSHVKFRAGFGKSVMSTIAKLMQELELQDASCTNDHVYRQALSAIHEYQKRHEELGYDLSIIKSFFPEHIWHRALEFQDTSLAGSFIMDCRGKKNNLAIPFADLAENRHSVREFAPTSVPQEKLEAAYETTMRTPSVCNRQASRLYQITDPQIIKAVLDIQGGFAGYAIPPVLLLVTSDIRAFMIEAERNEPFVDGGLFTMTLLYALEAYGLAACPLNAMFNAKQDRATRKLLNLPDYELPVAYVAVGEFPKEVPVCKSARKKYNEILKKI